MSVDKAKKKTRRIYCKASCSKISSKAYSAKNEKHIKTKNNLLGNAKNFYDGRKIVIDGFKNGIFTQKKRSIKTLLGIKMTLLIMKSLID